jgi:hypothetical protein
MDDFESTLKRRMEWDTAVQEVEKAVRFRLDAMDSRFSYASEDDKERLAQAWVRILQG